MTQRNYQPGVLANAKNGVPLHPAKQGNYAGGMTYRPPVVEDEPTLELVRTCPELTNGGDACKANPGPDGLCTGHRNRKQAAERAAVQETE